MTDIILLILQIKVTLKQRLYNLAQKQNQNLNTEF